MDSQRPSQNAQWQTLKPAECQHRQVQPAPEGELGLCSDCGDMVEPVKARPEPAPNPKADQGLWMTRRELTIAAVSGAVRGAVGGAFTIAALELGQALRGDGPQEPVELALVLEDSLAPIEDSIQTRIVSAVGFSAGTSTASAVGASVASGIGHSA